MSQHLTCFFLACWFHRKGGKSWGGSLEHEPLNWDAQDIWGAPPCSTQPIFGPGTAEESGFPGGLGAPLKGRRFVVPGRGLTLSTRAPVHPSLSSVLPPSWGHGPLCFLKGTSPRKTLGAGPGYQITENPSQDQSGPPLEWGKVPKREWWWLLHAVSGTCVTDAHNCKWLQWWSHMRYTHSVYINSMFTIRVYM